MLQAPYLHMRFCGRECTTYELMYKPHVYSTSLLIPRTHSFLMCCGGRTKGGTRFTWLAVEHLLGGSVWSSCLEELSFLADGMMKCWWL